MHSLAATCGCACVCVYHVTRIDCAPVRGPVVMRRLTWSGVQRAGTDADRPGFAYTFRITDAQPATPNITQLSLQGARTSTCRALQTKRLAYYYISKYRTCMYLLSKLENAVMRE